jgi:hypothetical protein
MCEEAPCHIAKIRFGDEGRCVTTGFIEASLGVTPESSAADRTLAKLVEVACTMAALLSDLREGTDRLDKTMPSYGGTVSDSVLASVRPFLDKVRIGDPDVFSD